MDTGYINESSSWKPSLRLCNTCNPILILHGGNNIIKQS